jgi:dihydroorotate dehydrogenase electron transfer subunit
MDQIQNTYKVISNEKLCPQFWCLSFDAPALAKEVLPGQFVHIRTSDGLEPFFRRPFSVYRAQRYVEIFYDPIGPGTKLLANKKKGDLLDVLGPLGTPFVMPPAEIKKVVMIAGGIGVAPMLLLSDILKKKTSLELHLLFGGRTRAHVYPMKEFKDNGVKVHIATDDGSVGVKGRVSNLFEKVKFNSSDTFIYTCGPNPMMKAVQDFAVKNKIQGQAACEEIMACALGACLGCSIETKSGFKTVCYDGPAFDLDEVFFH